MDELKKMKMVLDQLDADKLGKVRAFVDLLLEGKNDEAAGMARKAAEWAKNTADMLDDTQHGVKM